MTDSLRLSVPDLGDEAQAGAFYRVADVARDLDGHDPFNDQARVDVAAGHRSPIAVIATRQNETVQQVGSAIVGGGELDLVIDPVFRGLGFGRVALNGLLPTLHGTVTAWSHGDHPAARVLAEATGFKVVRTLLRLRLDPLSGPWSASQPPAGITVDAFSPGTDDTEWVALNAEIFAEHPEQGSLGVADLQARQSEPWFDAGDFLVAREEGRMVGYNWLKLEPDSDDGEIYVVGVSPALAGRGLGRALMIAGLRRMQERGREAATLYVEADNKPAVQLYRSLGFIDDLVDVQYRRSG